MPRPDKVSREEIRNLVYQGYRDSEIAQRLNRSATYISRVRRIELGIHKRGEVFYLQIWKNLIWIKNRHLKSGVQCASVPISLALCKKLGFDALEKICFRLTPSGPKQLIIDFCKESEVNGRR